MTIILTAEDQDLIDVGSGFEAIYSLGGNLEISAAAKYSGNFGFAFTPYVGKKVYGVRYLPALTSRFRCALMFSQNTFTANDATYQNILRDLNYANGFLLRIHRSGAVYNMQPVLYRDGGGQSNGTEIAIPSTGFHKWELDWKASSAPGANDGYLKLWLDDIEQAVNLGSKDNDTIRINILALGFPTNAVAGAAGVFFVDDFAFNTDGADL